MPVDYDKNAQEALRWAYKLAVEEKILPRPGRYGRAWLRRLLDGKLA